MSQQLQEYATYQDITYTNIGTGVTKTRLNTDTQFEIAADGYLSEFIPIIGQTAAFTAAESLLIRYHVESSTISGVSPVEYIAPVVCGGLGTFAFAQFPKFNGVPVNIPVKAGDKLSYFGEAQIANTVSPECGVSQYLTSKKLGPQMNWDAPDNETSTGLSATTVGLSTTSLDKAKAIVAHYGRISPGTVTASESYYGMFRTKSKSFKSALNIETPAQSIAAALGTAVALGIPGDKEWPTYMLMNNPNGILDHELVLAEALTAAGAAIVGVAYVRN